MKDTVWLILISVFMIAFLFMLVRPGSPAGTAVKDLTAALTALITTATTAA